VLRLAARFEGGFGRPFSWACEAREPLLTSATAQARGGPGAILAAAERVRVGHPGRLRAGGTNPAGALMGVGGKAAAGDIPSWLLADVGRHCNAQEVVLSCGTAVLGRWEAGPGPRFLVAGYEFGVGADAFELRVLDERPRELRRDEVEALRALLAELKRRLEAVVPAAQQAEIRRVEEHVSLVVDYVAEGFALLDSDWTIEHVNTQFERDVGRPRAELIGRRLWDEFPLLRGSLFEAEVRAAMEGTVPRVFEEFEPRRGRWSQWRVYPCERGLAMLSIDITERKTDELTRASIEQNLLQVQRMEALGTLASGIAHDFNNILGAILGHVGLLREQVPARSAARESVEQIGVAGARARDLVHRILAFSRESKREYVRQPLGPLVEESLGLMRATLPASVRLDDRPAGVPLSTTLNPSEVHQVVMNLCTNAWHALGGEPGRIEVALDGVVLEEARPARVGVLVPGHRYAVLTVRDNGSGMTAETLERLFEPFFTTKPRGKGTGLGLHVVQSIVTAHGGAVGVDSTPGAGTDFVVYLPATESREVGPAPAPVDVTTPGRGERVAYVDDDEVVLLMVERLLDRAGYAVTAYSSPQDLLDAVRRGTSCFDLLITDYSMPGMTGLDLAREVRALCPGLPVVVSSGFVSEELRAAADTAGVRHVLHKENSYEELPSLAARALAGMAASRA
jgi:PAS domain S-box-containing protein